MAGGLWPLSGHPRSEGAVKLDPQTHGGDRNKDLYTPGAQLPALKALLPTPGPPGMQEKDELRHQLDTAQTSDLQRQNRCELCGPTSQMTPTDTGPWSAALHLHVPQSHRLCAWSSPCSPGKQVLARPSISAPTRQLLFTSAGSASWAPGPCNAPASCLPLQHH